MEAVVLAASLLVAATLLQGCTLLGIASTTASISSPKHGWFDVNAKLVEKSELRLRGEHVKRDRGD